MNNINNSANELMIPIYLDEKIIVDLLASIEDGFSAVSDVAISTSTTGVKGNHVEAGASVNGVLSRLLEISFSGESEKTQTIINTTNSTSQRIHTMGSLFAKLHKHLLEKQMLKVLSEEEKSRLEQLETGDFIEISGKLERNPLISFLESSKQLISLSKDFESASPGKGKSKKTSGTDIIRLLTSLLNGLKISGMEDFVIKNETSVSVVLSLKEEYLLNSNTYELIGGTFKVVGKVMSIYRDEDINLLRNTSLSMIQPQYIENLFSGFNTVEQLSFSKLDTTIEKPAIIVIPIAVFL